MEIRIAVVDDIPQMEVVRYSVKENVLSTPGLVSTDDYVSFLTDKGIGWVCVVGEVVVGFAVIDIEGRNVWALFVHPDFEKQGIGKQLQAIMLDWYFQQTDKSIWLSTSPNTRAEGFYRKSGWVDMGRLTNGEIKFEMSYDEWVK